MYMMCPLQSYGAQLSLVSTGKVDIAPHAQIQMCVGMDDYDLICVVGVWINSDIMLKRGYAQNITLAHVCMDPMKAKLK